MQIIQIKPKEKLTAAEMGKLWATYLGNSMSTCVLNYYLQHVEDKDIKDLLKNALTLCNEFILTIEEIFTKENFPIPDGFTEKDVNIDAPRLFEDDFYVHHLKYLAKAGMSIYSVGSPLMYRKDVKDFFIYCLDSTNRLMEQIKEILMSKGLIIKPHIIPIPEKVEYVHENFLNGFFGDVRPLHALEITHLYDNIENNVTSNAIIMAFAQVVRDSNIRKLFNKGRELTTENVERYIELLHKNNLPSPSTLDHLVSNSTFSPFSDKLMLFHKMDMFSMKIRAFGNSVAVNGRHDLAMNYSKSLIKISSFVEDASKIMIGKGWFQRPPLAKDR
ncbi:hypothetical protein WQ54_09655 [Bacillus sp. SA1-12]|uniref:DUF3231 family protein n=1 Tax=Bacillus sp. SA1-12 TaxID=1455638 RepID=UPI000625DED2|nr:DUF3231 family protein [Bacillus sp. SA1-12]KKI92424.1 hypothetical protein WQ54_09655 [Bacillus sp. SA1-12]